MGYAPKRAMTELNTSSVADIDFLLLTFFLLTTVIADEKGLSISLPRWYDDPPTSEVAQRNLFKIQINYADQVMVQGKQRNDLSGLKDELKSFIMNFGEDPNLSQTPEKAIVSLKTDRGTSHRAYIQVLDIIQSAYNEIYAARAELSLNEYLKLNPDIDGQKRIIQKAREGIPMNISIAEPSQVGR